MARDSHVLGFQTLLFTLDNISKAFAKAVETAFENLMQKLEISKEFNAYVEAEIERQALPAQLLAEVRFDDSDALLPNGRLDAGETGDLIVTVRNQGGGTGYDVTLDVSPPQAEITVSNAPTALGRIAPGESREARLAISAGLALPTGETSFVVRAEEKRGYDARTVEFVLPTSRLDIPSLSIVTHEIDDTTTGTGIVQGNGNGIAESGETVELLVFVRNDGPGPTVGATLSAAAVGEGVEVIQGEAALGAIHPNQTARGMIALSIPRTYDRSKLALDLQVRDGRGETAGSLDRQVTLDVRPRAPVLVTSSRMLHEGREVRELMNDQTVELEVVARNTGTLDAEDVTIQVRAEQPGVSIPEAKAAVGALKARTGGAPRRWALTLPPTFDSPLLRLAIRLQQRGFSIREDFLELPVRIRQPVLAATFNVVGQRGDGMEQNETANLEVRVDNTGDLPARNVQVTLEAGHPGVELQRRQPIDVGTILPGERARRSFGVRVHRSVPPGEQPLILTIKQADRPALNETLRVPIHSERTEVQRARTLPSPQQRASVQPQPPTIAVAWPREDRYVREARTELVATVVDQRDIDLVTVVVNGTPVPEETVRLGLVRQQVPQGSTRDSATLTVPVDLKQGLNAIVITAYNSANLHESFPLNVTRIEDQPGFDGSPDLVGVADVDSYILALDRRPGRIDPGRWAVIIGIEQYRKAPPAKFAVRDALAMREYATKVLGVPSNQIHLLLDEKATKAELQVLLEDQLLRNVGSEDTVFVYFAGHGIPSAKDRIPYLLPADGDPQSLRHSAYAAEDLYAALAKLDASRVVVFLDACFSGNIARQGQLEQILEGTRPARLIGEGPVLEAPNLAVFSAARNDQVSNAYPEKAHGLFTYFLLNGLKGEADLNQDDELRLTELAEYLQNNVSLTANRHFGQELAQTPSVQPRDLTSRDFAVLRTDR